MLTIYTQDTSPRLSYTIETLFEDILGVPVRITQNKEQLISSAPCLNYSHEEIADVNYLRPHSLLFEEGIRKIPEKMNPQGILFPADSNVLEQDVLAASFFLLSRYEEYTDTDYDSHGRRMAKNSQMFQSGLLTRPLVDEWAFELYDNMRVRYKDLPAPNRNFTILPTFDIDIAFAYRGRSLIRRWKATLKDVSTLAKKRLKERNMVLKNNQQDPFDSYAYQKTSCQSRGLESRHFFLLADRGPLDNNLSHKSTEQRTMINEVAQWSAIGIHPSMGSNQSERNLKKEIERLTSICGVEVSRSRQHFLYIDLPKTYQNLIAQGIREDYSMGYADQVGFRAGSSHTFRWFDLQKNEATALYLIPITVMDSTLKDYLRLKPNEAIAVIDELKKSVEAVGGVFVPLWHNHTLTNYGDWKGWKSVYESSITSE
jgi:hypothetical protein